MSNEPLNWGASTTNSVEVQTQPLNRNYNNDPFIARVAAITLSIIAIIGFLSHFFGDPPENIMPVTYLAIGALTTLITRQNKK